MKIRNYLLTLAATACIACASAAPPSPSDYAEGFSITVTAPGPIITVPLTAQVYRAAGGNGLTDIAIFNGQGEPVPHTLRTTALPVDTSERRPVALPVFPHAEEDSNDTSSTISISAGGTLVRIDGAKRPVRPAPAPKRYLLDASHVDTKIVALQVEFEPGQGDLLATVALDTANDLDRWREAVSHRQLASLRYEGHTLEQLRIPLPAVKARYLRLRFLEQGDAGRIARVLAEVEPLREARSARERRLVRGIAPDESANEITFDLGAALPVREIGVVMQANMLFEATLQSRASVTADWHARHQGVFYALDRSGVLLRPSPTRVGLAPRRYWRLTDFKPTRPDPASIELEVSWQPASVAFVAAGGPPYTLALGRVPGAEPLVEPASGVGRFAGSSSSGAGVIGERHELGGAEKRVAVTTIPWQRIGLWSVLLIGVAGAAMMVLRLLRQMRD